MKYDVVTKSADLDTMISNGLFIVIIWSIVILALIWFFIRSAVKSGVVHAYFEIEEYKKKHAHRDGNLLHESKEEHEQQRHQSESNKNNC